MTSRRVFMMAVPLAIAAAAAVTLFSLSQRTQKAERALGALEREIAERGEAIRVLEAEWHYLTRPERLAGLAEERLDLVPPGERSELRVLDPGQDVPEPVIPFLPSRKPDPRLIHKAGGRL